MTPRLVAPPRRSTHLESHPCTRPPRRRTRANRRKFPLSHPLALFDLSRRESIRNHSNTLSRQRRPLTRPQQECAISAPLTRLESNSCTISRSNVFRITFLRKNRGGEVITLTIFPKWNSTSGAEYPLSTRAHLMSAWPDGNEPPSGKGWAI